MTANTFSTQTHELTWIETLRVKLAAALHTPLSGLGMYAESKVGSGSYAGTIPTRYKQFEAELHRLGFIRNFGSSLKYRDTEIGEEEKSVASWVYYPDGAATSDYQLHIDLFVGPNDEQTDVYAHWEPSWIRHPIKHYQANDVDAEKGIRMFLDMLEDEGIAYLILPTDARFGPDRVATGY